MIESIWLLALWKASEGVLGKVLDKGFDAAGKPIEEGLSSRFKKLAGTDEASQRQAAFVSAEAKARALTREHAEAERILKVLDDRLSAQLADDAGEREREGAAPLRRAGRGAAGGAVRGAAALRSILEWRAEAERRGHPRHRRRLPGLTCMMR